VKLLPVTAIFGAMLVASCAGSRPPDAMPFSESLESRDGYAKLCICRPHNRRNGSAIWPDIFIQGRKIVELEDDAYTVLFVGPGRYVLRVEKGHPLWSGTEVFPFEITRLTEHYVLFDTKKRHFGGSLADTLAHHAGGL